VQHGVALLQQTGDLARAEAERLAIEAPREDQRSSDAEREGQQDGEAHRRQCLLELRRDLLFEEADRHDADHAAGGVRDRDLRAHGSPKRSLLEPDIFLSRERRARIGRHALADVVRIRMRVADAVLVRDHHERSTGAAADRLGDRLDDRRRIGRAHSLENVGRVGDRVRDR